MESSRIGSESSTGSMINSTLDNSDTFLMIRVTSSKFNNIVADNKSTVFLTLNLTSKNRIRHLDNNYHFI